MKPTITALAIAVGMATMTAGAVHAQDVKMTLAHPYPDTQPIGDGFNLWAARVNEISDGRIDVRVFPGGTLIGTTEMFSAVSTGSVQAGGMIAGLQVGDIPELAVFGLPFMFANDTEFRAASDAGLFEMAQAWYESKGIKLLNLFPHGSVEVFHTDKFILEPDDFKGVQIRGVGGPASAALVALGANEVRLPASEVTTAMQRGVADALITNCLAHIGRSWYEQTPYASVIGFANDAEGLGVNLEFWNGLSEEDQQVMMQAAGEMEDFEWDLMRDVGESRCINEWKELGVNVAVATPEQTETLKAALAPVFETYRSEIPALDEAQAIINSVR